MRIQQLKTFSYDRENKTYVEDSKNPTYDNLKPQKMEEIRYADRRRTDPKTGKLFNKQSDSLLPYSEIVENYVFSDFGCISPKTLEDLVKLGFMKILP